MELDGSKLGSLEISTISDKISLDNVPKGEASESQQYVCVVNPYYAAVGVKTPSGGHFTVMNIAKKDDTFNVVAHGAELLDLAWSPHSDVLLVSSSADGTVKIWKLQEKNEKISDIKQIIRMGSFGSFIPRFVAWHPSVKDIMVTAGGEDIYVLDLKMEEIVSHVKLKGMSLESITWGKGGGEVITGNGKGNLWTFGAKSGALLMTAEVGCPLSNEKLITSRGSLLYRVGTSSEHDVIQVISLQDLKLLTSVNLSCGINSDILVDRSRQLFFIFHKHSSTVVTYIYSREQSKFLKGSRLNTGHDKTALAALLPGRGLQFKDFEVAKIFRITEKHEGFWVSFKCKEKPSGMEINELYPPMTGTRPVVDSSVWRANDISVIPWQFNASDFQNSGPLAQQSTLNQPEVGGGRNEMTVFDGYNKMADSEVSLPADRVTTANMVLQSEDGTDLYFTRITLTEGETEEYQPPIPQAENDVCVITQTLVDHRAESEPAIMERFVQTPLLLEDNDTPSVSPPVEQVLNRANIRTSVAMTDMSEYVLKQIANLKGESINSESSTNTEINPEYSSPREDSPVCISCPHTELDKSDECSLDTLPVEKSKERLSDSQMDVQENLDGFDLEPGVSVEPEKPEKCPAKVSVDKCVSTEWKCQAPQGSSATSIHQSVQCSSSDRMNEEILQLFHEICNPKRTAARQCPRKKDVKCSLQQGSSPNNNAATRNCLSVINKLIASLSGDDNIEGRKTGGSINEDSLHFQRRKFLEESFANKSMPETGNLSHMSLYSMHRSTMSKTELKNVVSTGIEGFREEKQRLLVLTGLFIVLKISGTLYYNPFRV